MHKYLCAHALDVSDDGGENEAHCDEKDIIIS